MQHGAEAQTETLLREKIMSQYTVPGSYSIFSWILAVFLGLIWLTFLKFLLFVRVISVKARLSWDKTFNSCTRRSP
jgi:hypothetical protein